MRHGRRRSECQRPGWRPGPQDHHAAGIRSGADGREYCRRRIHTGAAAGRCARPSHGPVTIIAGEPVENLDKDRAFLKNGGVFDGDFIELKMAEVERFEMTPHPVEFDMYYSQ